MADEKTLEDATLEDVVESFLAIGFDIENSKVFSTQRAAREEAYRIVGFNQAQAALINFLEQINHPLAKAERHPQVLKPIEIGGRSRLWTPPELPVKARKR